MRLKSIIKNISLIPQQNGIYNSFPTVVMYNHILYLFYRRGKANRRTCYHGSQGVVCLTKIPLSQNKINCEEVRHDILFRNGNEIDAIASNPVEGIYCLSTRLWQKKPIAYLSVNNEPSFVDRVQVTVKGCHGLVLYGKVIAYDDIYYIPAYGFLGKNENVQPLLLCTTDFIQFDLHCVLPEKNDVILSETSIVRIKSDSKIVFRAYCRQNNYPYGLLYCESDNMQEWSPLKRLNYFAHAPQSIATEDNHLVLYRELIETHKSSLSLYNNGNNSFQRLDEYSGFAYDGGYGDLIQHNNILHIFYYKGNDEGEPGIEWIQYSI